MPINEIAQRNIDFVLKKFGLEPARGHLPTIIPDIGRDGLARLFCEMKFESGVEVGVEKGLYSAVLASENPQAKIYGVDNWKVYSSYRDHVVQSKLDAFYESTIERLKPYPNWRPIREFSMDAVRYFEDGELDFVYIDGNHTLPYVLNDIIEWSKKVRIGGIVSGHDYRKSKRIVTQNHVVYAVQCFVESYRIKPWFLLGRKAVIPGETRDDNRSWMWIRIR
jgi:hypothetical protein